MRRTKKIILFLLLGSVFVFYNNCAKLMSDDSDTNSGSQFLSSNGNGTPYGGKLSLGEYIPSQNQICPENTGQDEKIEVREEGGRYNAYHQIPCQNREDLLDQSLIEVTADRTRALFNNVGFAYESTDRAKNKSNYKIGCRTTEVNYGAELLVYGLGPVYTFEHLRAQSQLVLYSAPVVFVLNSATYDHEFLGDNDVIGLRYGDVPSLDRFAGFWSSSILDSSGFASMICDRYDQSDVNAW